LENARFQWESGAERTRAAAAEDAVAGRETERIVSAVREELRRRLGTGFSAEQLAALYGEGTDWCLALAIGLAGGYADPHDAVDAAFWDHLRLARDFAGGVTATDRESDAPAAI